MVGTNKDVIRRFWDAKAREDSNRWTPKELLDFEVNLISEAADAPGRILDLGSGHGELSRIITGPLAQLIAVDWIDDFRRSFTAKNQNFVRANVLKYRSTATYDLLLLFGVVTYLTKDEEVEIYQNCARLVSGDGVLIVKNQCARGEEFEVNGRSEALQMEYSGRYPNMRDQETRLAASFDEVSVVEYPSAFNVWEDSFHVAFVCRSPRDPR